MTDGDGTIAERGLSGSATGIRLPRPIAADDAGRIYVTETPPPDVPGPPTMLAVFSPTASGNVPPGRTLAENINEVGLAVAP